MSMFFVFIVIYKSNGPQIAKDECNRKYKNVSTSPCHKSTTIKGQKITFKLERQTQHFDVYNLFDVQHVQLMLPTTQETTSTNQ